MHLLEKMELMDKKLDELRAHLNKIEVVVTVARELVASGKAPDELKDAVEGMDDRDAK